MQRSVARALCLAAITSVASLMLLGPALADSAIVTRSVETIPFTNTFISCTGEPVLASGTLVARDEFITDATGHIAQVLNLTGTGTAVGEITGTQYVFREMVINPSQISVIAGPLGIFETTASITLHLISQASGQELIVRRVIHLTILADGTVAVSFDNIQSCPTP